MAYRAAKLLAGLAVIGALAGCINHGGKPQTFYLLTARAQPTAATPLATTLGIGPVRIAPFLKRPQQVTHAGGGALQVAEQQRWSEPLEQGIQRVLLQNLAADTGADMRNFPWTQTTIPRFALRVDVIDLDRAADGNALLDVQWTLEDVAQNKLLESRREQFRAAMPDAADDGSALAAAYSDLLAQLSARMAQAVGAQALIPPPAAAIPPRAAESR